MSAYQQSFRTLVILQADRAFWFKFKNDKLIDSHVERLFSDGLPRQSSCPWVDADAQGMELAVELILDTNLDELDRVNVDTHASRLVQRIQIKTLMRKLRTDFPDASVFSLPDYLEPDCATILHHVIPDSWEKWLQMLQAQAITISHVVTSTELFCHSFDVNAGLNLLIQDVGAEVRHLLIDGRTPVYMRLTPVEGKQNDSKPEDWSAQAITSTLDYIAENVLPENRVPVVSSLALSSSSLLPEFATTSLLSELYLGKKTQLIEKYPDSGESDVGNSNITLPRSAAQPVPGISLLRFLRLGNKHGWHLSAGAHAEKAVLTSSLHKNRTNSRIFRLQKATVLCAAMATISAALASTHAFTSARERQRLNSEKADLRNNIDSVSQSVLAAHTAPSFIVNSLQRIDLHKEVEPVAPEIVLATVADAITLFPSITLNGLAWTVINQSQLMDEVFTTTASVSTRDEMWSEGSPQAQLQLELTGTVNSSDGLRARQDTIDSFAAYLEGVPGIQHVSVLESPLASVLSNTDTLDAPSDYRMSVLLGAL